MIAAVVALFLSELRRDALVWWSYRVSAVGGLLMHAVVFPILLATFQGLATRQGVETGEAFQLASLLGFLVWYLSLNVMAAIPQVIRQEATVGTLETVLLSPVPASVVVSVRAAVLAIRYGLETLLLGLGLSLLLRLPLTLPPAAVLVVLLTVAGAAGAGLALAGLALVYKAVTRVVALFQYLALLVSGALVPLNALGVTFLLLKFLFPTTWGIDALRSVVVDGGGGQALIASGALAGLGLQTALLVWGGVRVFRWGLRRARRQGSLAAY